MYNFHNNKSINISEAQRYKDHLIPKFFLWKVFNEKIKNLIDVNSIKKNECVINSIKELKEITNYQFSLCKLIPRYKECKQDRLYKLFNFEWLQKEKTENKQSNKKIFDINTPYNNNLSQQIIRDFDEFYRIINLHGQEEGILGPQQRIILRNIYEDSEVLIFKKYKYLFTESIEKKSINCKK